MGEVGRSALATRFQQPVAPRSVPFPPDDPTPSVAFLETERGGSFFLTGGLAAVHALGHGREAIWDALDRRETYGTSGPRILLWFDLLDPAAPDGAWPMGSAQRLDAAPTFRVRAAGSFEPRPGCPEETKALLSPERLTSLCLGECYFPSNRRRPITRIEIIRIRRQLDPSEPIAPLIEDPWQTFSCEGGEQGCEVVFRDDEYPRLDRPTAYYARVVERASAHGRGGSARV